MYMSTCCSRFGERSPGPQPRFATVPRPSPALPRSRAAGSPPHPLALQGALPRLRHRGLYTTARGTACARWGGDTRLRRAWPTSMKTPGPVHARAGVCAMPRSAQELKHVMQRRGRQRIPCAPPRSTASASPPTTPPTPLRNPTPAQRQRGTPCPHGRSTNAASRRSTPRRLPSCSRALAWAEAAHTPRPCCRSTTPASDATKAPARRASSRHNRRGRGPSRRAPGAAGG